MKRIHRSCAFRAAPATAVVLLLSCGMPAAVAQIRSPEEPGLPPNEPAPGPRAASLSAPKGTHEAHEGESLALQWVQYLHSPTHLPAANHFRICVFDPVRESCSTAAPQWTATAAATAISPTVVYNGFGQPIGYSYTFVMPNALTPAQLDRQLNWTVRSCATTSPSSCTLAAPASLWLSTKNLRADNLSDQSYTETRDDRNGNPVTWAVLERYGEVENESATASGPFWSSIQTWPVLYDAGMGKCRTDMQGLPDDYYALTSSDEELKLADLPRDALGNYLGEHTIIALYSSTQRREGDSWLAQGHVQNVMPGASATTVGTFVELENPSLPIAIASLLIVDFGENVVEIDEFDNRHAECHVIR